MITRKLILGFARVHILYHASKEEIYGSWMIEELGRHGYSISPGTLYPILHEMEREGLLRSRKVVVDGRVRKMYRITEKGRKLLDDAREKVKELFEEIMEER
ncbi:PadR family transcriptional regulator [Archaeoglobus sp.]|uniref:PadR family transcriptional regulator n=1 Tax=Archaeoglobus sp. TaxID=1872626 RepID=UPI0024AADFF0|nr:PadR family transcriptional regulator [Archaeoglobus sp.]MDI3496809.1 hypothetical protein [Archaeoglobus sp.]